jgi:hypothetical protein
MPIHQKPLGPLAEIQIFETESFLSVGISPADKKITLRVLCGSAVKS